MKVGLFADPHYCSREISCTNRRPSLSMGKLGIALREFYRQKTELIICLGDLVDSDENKPDIDNLSEISGLIHRCGIECYCCMGNHDAFLFDKKSFEDISGIKAAPLVIKREGKALILLNANYLSSGAAYNAANIDWTDSNIPDEQLSWLKKTLICCTEPEIYVFLHQNLDPAVEKNHIIKNATEVRNIFARDGRVRAVYQGHYHPGAFNIYDNIRYITLKAMCEGYDNHYMVINI